MKRRTGQVVGITAAATALILGGMPFAAISASAALPSATVVTLTGSVGRLPAASGVVLVEAELALGRSISRQHVAKSWKTSLLPALRSPARTSG